MPSPFPGMDPYLEGPMWPDVHHRLGFIISDTLVDLIPDRYVIRIEPRLVEDNLTTEEIAVMFPDVLIRHPREQVIAGGASTATLTPRATFPVVAPFEVSVTEVTIRESATNSLVTSIEIVSPANKRGEGFQKFENKWRRLHRAGVHLIEIDLIRVGARIFPYPAAHSHYLLTVTRAGRSRTEAWPVSVREALPMIPVPLSPPDEDSFIDLQPMLDRIYDRAKFGKDVDYSIDPPAPPFSEADREWMRERIDSAGKS